MPPADQDAYEGKELAGWLQEVGRRRPNPHPLPSERSPLNEPEPAPGVPPAKRPRVQHALSLVLMALTALAYLEFFFADVYLQISSMRSFIVFIFTAGQAPSV